MTMKKPENICCAMCSKQFATKSKLRSHILTLHTGKSKQVSCKLCRKYFANRTFLKRHVLAIHDAVQKPYCCNVCDAAFSQILNLTKHIHMVHEGIKEFSCDICYKSFSFESNLRSHKLNKVCIEMFSCNECDESFESKADLKKHTRLAHTKIKLAFPQKRPRLLATKTLLPPVKKSLFSCELCAETFSNINALINHKNAHVKLVEVKVMKVKAPPETEKLQENLLKLFFCRICDETFSRLDDLINHKYEHVRTVKIKLKNHKVEAPESKSSEMPKDDNLKLYVCRICNKTFPNNDELRSHKYEHVRTVKIKLNNYKVETPKPEIAEKFQYFNLKLYFCKVCAEKFSNIDDLTNHKLSHMKASESKRIESPKDVLLKLYFCKVCAEKFLNLEDLIKHKIAHRSDSKNTEKQKDVHLKLYFCKICKVGFLTERVLQFHKRMMHLNAADETEDTELKDDNIVEENLQDDRFENLQNNNVDELRAKTDEDITDEELSSDDSSQGEEMDRDDSDQGGDSETFSTSSSEDENQVIFDTDYQYIDTSDNTVIDDEEEINENKVAGEVNILDEVLKDFNFKQADQEIVLGNSENDAVKDNYVLTKVTDNNIVCEDSIVEDYDRNDSAVEDHVDSIENDSMENNSMKNDSMENDLMENDSMENNSMENDSMENDLMEDSIVNDSDVVDEQDDFNQVTDETLEADSSNQTINDEFICLSQFNNDSGKVNGDYDDLNQATEILSQSADENESESQDGPSHGTTDECDGTIPASGEHEGDYDLDDEEFNFPILELVQD